MNKKSAIMQRYYGLRGHCETISCSPKYGELLDDVVKNDEEIRKKLAEFPDLLSLYEKTNSSIEALHLDTLDNYYLEGFRFGCLMGLDILGDEKTD